MVINQTSVRNNTELLYCQFAEGETALAEALTEKRVLKYQAIGYQLPEVFYDQIVHAVGPFDAAELAVAAVAGHDQHLGTCRTNLFHFAAAVENAIFVVTRGQCAAPAAAANLVEAVGVHINPVFETLIHDPAGLFKIAVPESFLSPAPAVAGIVVGGAYVEAPPVQSDASLPDICNQQVIY